MYNYHARVSLLVWRSGVVSDFRDTEVLGASRIGHCVFFDLIPHLLALVIFAPFRTSFHSMASTRLPTLFDCSIATKGNTVTSRGRQGAQSF